jgi:hypothetical protein
MFEKEEIGEVEEIKIIWKNYNKDSHHVSNNKKCVEAIETQTYGQTPRIFSNYKINDDEILIKIKINKYSETLLIGYIGKQEFLKKEFKIDNSNINEIHKLYNNNLTLNNDIIEILIRPWKKKIIIFNERTKVKEIISDVKFPIYLSCLLWNKGDSIEILSSKIIKIKDLYKKRRFSNKINIENYNNYEYIINLLNDNKQFGYLGYARRFQIEDYNCFEYMKKFNLIDFIHYGVYEFKIFYKINDEKIKFDCDKNNNIIKFFKYDNNNIFILNIEDSNENINFLKKEKLNYRSTSRDYELYFFEDNKICLRKTYVGGGRNYEIFVFGDINIITENFINFNSYYDFNLLFK